jgi:hypothetical protein
MAIPSNLVVLLHVSRHFPSGLLAVYICIMILGKLKEEHQVNYRKITRARPRIKTRIKIIYFELALPLK